MTWKEILLTNAANYMSMEGRRHTNYERNSLLIETDQNYLVNQGQSDCLHLIEPNVWCYITHLINDIQATCEGLCFEGKVLWKNLRFIIHYHLNTGYLTWFCVASVILIGIKRNLLVEMGNYVNFTFSFVETFFFLQEHSQCCYFHLKRDMKLGATTTVRRCEVRFRWETRRFLPSRITARLIWE